MLDKLRIIWRDLSTAGDFRKDWYGAATNQLSHTFVGAALAVFFSLCTGLLMGEMMPKVTLLGILIGGYLMFEVVVQGCKGMDTAYDTAFFGLGVGLIVVPFSEVAIQGLDVTLNFNASDFFWMAAIWLAVFVPYVFSRVR